MDGSASRWFVHANLLGCLVLQRFCLYVGGSPLFVCLLLFLLSLGWLFATGRAAFRLGPVVLFALLAAVTLLATLVAVDNPDLRFSGISVPSMFLVLLIYAGLVVGPSARFDSSESLRIIVLYIRVIAVLGIAQYGLQFVGIRLFSFMLAVPSLTPVLVEPLFNFQPWVGYGSSILRSNGFFLVEPSVFSQVLVLGTVIDVFYRRQWRFVPVYALAYLYTYAGTGLLALALAALLYALTNPAGSPRLLAFGTLTTVAAVVSAFAFPDQFGSLLGRSTELTATGSSGYARYVTQLDVIDTVRNETRTLIGFGPGALERATFYRAGGGSAALKLFIDYGWAGLISFVAFIIAALWRRPLALASLYVLVDFQFGGGYLLFPPLIVLGAMISIWSQPEPAAS